MNLNFTASSGALIFKENKLLIVKPSYKEGWEIPGGMIENCESPLDGLKRELKEEINLIDYKVNLLTVDWKVKKDHNNLSFMFHVYDYNWNQFKLDQVELIDYKFIEIEKTKDFFKESFAGRINVAFNSINSGVSYSEFGKKVF